MDFYRPQTPDVQPPTPACAVCAVRNLHLAAQTHHHHRGGGGASGRQASGIPREERRLADIIQAEEELHDAIQAQPTATVRAAAPLEGLGVVPEALALGPQAFQPHAFHEVRVAVDALGARHDFLAAHEEVVRVCEGGVVRGGVGVEGAEGAGVLVYGEEVCVVFFEDDFAEGFLLGGAGGRWELVGWIRIDGGLWCRG